MLDLNINLLSVSKLEDRGIHVATRLGGMDLVHESIILATATQSGGSYTLDLDTEQCVHLVYAITKKKII